MFLIRFGFIGSRPLHLVPFSSSCLRVFAFHSFFLLHAHGPALSVYTHNLLSVAQVFTMRRVVTVVPVHLVSFSLPPHTPWSRLVFSSCLHSFVSLRAHFHIRPGLSAFRLPSGRPVCVPSGITRFRSDCSVVTFSCRRL